MKKFWQQMIKYEGLILYVIFGVLTTLVNIVSYWILAHPFDMSVIPSTVIAWFLSVLFAYVTNRLWVFHSEADTFLAVLREVVSFFSCRIATGILDWMSMFAFVDIIHLDDMWVKGITNVVVIILNYVASKFVIFKQQKQGD